jgi:hypothetical protein
LTNRNSTIYPKEIITLLDEMFVKCDNNDFFEVDIIQNIPLHDNEEWETIEETVDEISMDIAPQSPTNRASVLFSSIQNMSISSLSSVTSFLKNLGGNNS